MIFKIFMFFCRFSWIYIGFDKFQRFSLILLDSLILAPTPHVPCTNPGRYMVHTPHAPFATCHPYLGPWCIVERKNLGRCHGGASQTIGGVANQGRRIKPRSGVANKAGRSKGGVANQGGRCKPRGAYQTEGGVINQRARSKPRMAG